MAPGELHILLLHVVGQTLIACLGHIVAEGEIALELVANGIAAFGGYLPGTLRIDVASNSQIDIVVDGEIIAAVAQIEALGLVGAIGRHKDSARIGFREREIAERDGNGERYIGNDEVSWSGNDILVWAQTSLGEFDIEVGTFGLITGGIASVFEIEKL